MARDSEDAPRDEPLAAGILSNIPGLRHAFFTRRGGVSEGIFASLNCGTGSQDDQRSVLENRARAAAHLGVGADMLMTAYQTHGTDVRVVRDPWNVFDRPEMDGMVTDRPGIALGILSADCAPVLFYDPRAEVIGAAHAGWRGTFAGILERTLAGMEFLGAYRTRIMAAIGPCIGPKSYEVSAQFPLAFLREDEENTRFFEPSWREDHFLFNLPGYVRHRLQQVGLTEIETLARDTCAEEYFFFSYRRAVLKGESDYGRNLAAIVLEE